MVRFRYKLSFVLLNAFGTPFYRRREGAERRASLRGVAAASVVDLACELHRTVILRGCRLA
jgi:hypothetical protein